MIIRLLKLVPDDTKIDFYGLRFVGWLLSGLLIVASVVSFSSRGLNLGIDFTGGTLMELTMPEALPIAELRTELNGLGLGDVVMQEFGSPLDLMIRLPQQEGGPDEQKAAIDKVRSALDSHFEEGAIDYRRVEFVGPQVGDELKMTAFWAMMASIIGILIYIWVRFEWQYGLGTIVSLVHDVVLIIGFFSITQMPFDLATFAAVLLVAGYSINDTVIIYDRIRENMRKFKKMPVKDIINMSVNQTLNRTLMTSVTTLVALLALWMFGGEVIKSFVAALFVGVAIGVYSTYFVAAPVLDYLNLRRITEKEDAAENASAPA